MRGININDNNASFTSIVFKFKNRAAWPIALSLAAGTVLFLGIVAIRRGEVRFAIEFIWILLWLYAIFGVIGICGISDLIIDEIGISRRILGKTWQSIRWDNVKLIRQFSMYGQATGKIIKVFHVFPLVYPSTTLGLLPWPTRKMVFTERVDDPDKLINTLNYFVEKYHLHVEEKIEGSWHPATQVNRDVKK